MTTTNDKIIRVFARRTSMTPTDELAFCDEPPLFDLPELPVRVSVAFTWDIPRGHMLYRAWQKRFKNVRIGGPAITPRPGRFVPGRFLSPGITITSRGCPKCCPWCHVKFREYDIRELPIEPGYIIQDNNLLACSEKHICKVFAMLGEQSRAACFRGGLDIDYLRSWHVELLRSIRVSEIWIACDSEASIANLDKAADLLSDFPEEKKRCYCLVGYDLWPDKDTPAKAERRCAAIYAKGFLPFAQLYQVAQWKDYSPEWKAVQRKWSRPAAYRKKKFVQAGS
jgi:hypothetical protein